MTITISGTKSISTGTLGNPIYSYSPFSTYPMVSVTDTATQTVTLTVVQSSFLHSNPGASNDVTSPVQPGAFTLRFYANGGMETNPPTISGNTFTVTGPLNSTNVGTYNPSGSPMYGPVAYSPIDSLTFLQAAVPTARLVGNQILETDFTLTATDSTGGIATQLTKYLSTNPVQAAFATALGTANAQAITKPFAGLAVTNTNDIVFNRYTDNGVFISTTYGSTTITVTQTNILHTDPALSGGDQRISVAPGTLSFTAQGGDATNAPTFDPTTGTLVATGTIRSPALGTADPIDYPSGYTPHDYSPAQEVSNLTFAPASSIHLSANQTLETDFTLTVTDGVTGSSQVLTRAQTLTAPTTNPITVTNVAVSTSSGTLVAGQTIAFTLALSGSVSISGGLPTITLNDGGTATYSPAASTATSLTFNYTVGLGDATTSLALARLNLNGSAIAASNGSAISLASGAFFTPLGSGNLTVAGTPPITTTSVYRFFDTGAGTHFFTSSIDERNTLLATRPDLVQESNGFGAVAANTPNAVAVYRFFDTVHGTQFITSNASERDTVQASRPDLSFEAGDEFYEHSVQQTGDVSVYRFFDTKLGTHFYTGSQSEHDSISTPGGAGYRADLISEGVAFYAPSGTFK